MCRKRNQPEEPIEPYIDVEPEIRRLEEIEEELREIEAEENRLELQLLDVLTDVDTPEVSEDEDEFDCVEEATQELQLFKNNLLRCFEEPVNQCDYLVLYQNEDYKNRGRRKIKLLKKEVKTTVLQEILEDECYAINLARIEEHYPDNGGRIFLNELVAIYQTKIVD